MMPLNCQVGNDFLNARFECLAERLIRTRA